MHHAAYTSALKMVRKNVKNGSKIPLVNGLTYGSQAELRMYANGLVYTYMPPQFAGSPHTKGGTLKQLEITENTEY